MPIGYEYLETAGRSYGKMKAQIVNAGGRRASEDQPLPEGWDRVVIADYFASARCAVSTTAEGARTAWRDLQLGARVNVYDVPEGTRPTPRVVTSWPMGLATVPLDALHEIFAELGYVEARW